MIRSRFLFFVFVPVLSVAVASAQQSDSSGKFIQLTLGLGVSAHSDPTVDNYINALTLPAPGQGISDFTSASEFFVTPEIQVSDDVSIGLEYSYFLKSYNIAGPYPWNFSYSAQMSTLFLHYLLPGDGYVVKLGGGMGYAFGKLSEQFAETGGEETSTASGPSFKIEAVGNTKFDDHFWGSIGVDLRWVYAGEFKGHIVATAPTPKLDFFNVGVKFGVTFQI